MPSNVTRFEQLAYLSLGIGIVVAALQYPSLSGQAGAGFTLFVQAFVLGFLFLLVWLIARRRKNWARWVLLILFLVGIPAYIPILSDMLLVSSLSGILSIVQLFTQGVALYLIFTGDAASWFKKTLPEGSAHEK